MGLYVRVRVACGGSDTVKIYSKIVRCPNCSGAGVLIDKYTLKHASCFMCKGHGKLRYRATFEGGNTVKVAFISINGVPLPELDLEEAT